MSELTQGILIGLVPAILVSFFTAWITVKFSMRQFYSQRWWEKKAEAYSRIIEELSCLQYCLGEWFDSSVEHKKFSDEKKEELSRGYRKAEEAIRRSVAMGSYIISESSIKALENLIRELETTNNQGDWVGDMDAHFGAVKKCIERIREYAKKDLGHE